MDPVYRQEYTIRSCDVDSMRRLRLSSLFVMLQEAAIAHTTELGMGRHMTLDRGFLWVITLQNVWIRRLPVYDEHISIISWPERSMHIYFPRSFRIEDADGELLVEASTVWGLMDQKTRHLIFPEDHGINIDGCREMPSLPFPKVPSPEVLQEMCTYTVPYSCTDINGHMNNTRYFDLAEDMMPPELRSRAVNEISSSFDSEIFLGDTVSLFSSFDGDTYVIEGRNSSGKRCFRVRLTYS